MKEMIVRPGDRIDLACERLLKEAPAFMVFNGTRLEARLGDTVQAIYNRWNAARPEPIDQLAKLRDENAKLRAALVDCAHAGCPTAAESIAAIETDAKEKR